ncbi:helix-turn-helix domain-containing protein [Arthrobacter sp. 24S4-2]|uniref:AraC-like ligand-binding domain-containing protein n=1 Tax=Arthrobacter sp. 24S4-2 TaxID=2575374 RepID=UPI0010C77B7C|nr:helix-turn-helix domain-containing protein [Arthrobacter sp. 24S4-2]QCO98037.1 helix-turn-helix domain-containing protein [Arthrobacter sp. 24S4-2]
MELISTDRLAVAERFDAYRTAISEAFVPLDAAIGAGPSFEAVLRSEDLGQLSVTDISATAHVVARTPQSIRAGDPENYKLGLQVNGYSVVSQDGREAALTPGDFALYDTSRPYTLSFDQSYRMMVVMFPRTLLRLPERPVSTLTARRISGRQGIGALLSPFLVNLGRQLTTSDSAVNVHLGDAVLDLLAATFAEQLQLSSLVSPETHQRALTLKIRAFISERLGDAELSPAQIAAAHHISLRYLHRLFELEGHTVNGWIRSQRMERCRRDLTDPRHTSISVSAIAARWGLANPAHFSRLFKATYGATPGEYRSAKPQGQ